MAELNQVAVKDADTIRDDVLRTIKNGLIEQDVAEPNVGPTSDFYNIATALGNELTVVGANSVIKTDAQMPDTATDDEDPSGDQDLTRIAEMLDLEPQPAAGSVGSVVIESSATAPIAVDTELTDDLGQRYKVTLGGNYANGASVPIEAISTGESTNRDAGDVLTWSEAPPFCSEKATVAAGGLINGADAEDSEALRERIFAKLQVPPGSGDWEQVAETAEASTNSVQKAFVYPSAQGPSTCDVAVTAAPTSTNKSRAIATALLNGTVKPYTEGKLPKFGLLTTTTVEDVNADVAIGLTLPDAPTANPPGPGGGWIDGAPWPAPNGTSTFRCTVTAVTSTTQFTVDATTAPTANVSHIAWLSPTEWKLYRAVVIAVSGSSGAYVITLDKPLVGIATGSYIWPDCQNAQLYVNALLAAFALMGPGEKTSNASALFRGFRHPPPSTSWPYSLGPHLLQAITNAQEEASSAQFFHRTDGTTTVTGSAGTVTPQVPAAIANAPKQFTPRHIGFYRIAS
jgi:uncharacterized phage protein gp47/JayE